MRAISVPAVASKRDTVGWLTPSSEAICDADMTPRVRRRVCKRISPESPMREIE